MKIVMFSINPLFPKQVTGGASKHLYHIAMHLGRMGHEIEILCARSKGQSENFTWADTVRVSPVLPFNLPFPQPYAISGADLALIVQALARSLKDADRFYIHDGEWLIPDVYDDIPTIVSFRDNIYPESVLGSFINKADDIICVSSYSKKIIEHTACRFFPGLIDRIHQVNNGIDLNHFSPVSSFPLAAKLGLDSKKDHILLHPHRPEPGKGLPETIRVVNALVHKHGIQNLQVLIPEWINEMVSPGESSFYHSMLAVMRDLDVEGYFKFIPWIPNNQMPELYSLGEVTLCLGNIVEAFGNVAYESLACGTPSVVAKVGVHRTLLPDHLISKVPFGDIGAAVNKILAIFAGDIPSESQTRGYLSSHLNFQEQVNTYARIITNSQKQAKVKFVFPPGDSNQAYVLAPWCYWEEERLYHDFTAEYASPEKLNKLCKMMDVFNYQDAVNLGVSEAEWQSWIDKTFIVPGSND